LGKDGAVTVKVDVKNTGKRAGDEVVQMYVRYPESKVERPSKQLRGFKRVTLRAGEKKTVELPLKAEALAYWDDGSGKFTVESGAVEVLVGTSSADTPLRKMVVVE
jgi:beta-glucosidase